MPRGTHPNSLANLQKGRAHRFTSETAAKYGRKGAEASNPAQRQRKTIRELAQIVGASPVESKKLREQLASIGVPEGEMTNDAVILAAVFQAAIHGDMKAIEKWERYLGQADERSSAADGQLADLIDGLKEPVDDDLYAQTAGIDGNVAKE